MLEIAVTATEANRSFSRLLRQVQKGDRIRVTSHGRTVAIITAPTDEADAERAAKLEALGTWRQHWAEIESIDVGSWTRNDIYDRDAS